MQKLFQKCNLRTHFMDWVYENFLRNCIDCHRAALMTNQHRLKKWFGAIRLQASTWVNVDPDLLLPHRPSLSHNITHLLQGNNTFTWTQTPLQWRHDGRDGVWNHNSYDCLLKRLFRRRSKKTSKLCITGQCEGNSPVTGEFPTQMASNAEDGSIWWRHHAISPVPLN